MPDDIRLVSHERKLNAVIDRHTCCRSAVQPVGDACLQMARETLGTQWAGAITLTYLVLEYTLLVAYVAKAGEVSSQVTRHCWADGTPEPVPSSSPRHLPVSPHLMSPRAFSLSLPPLPLSCSAASDAPPHRSPPPLARSFWQTSSESVCRRASPRSRLRASRGPSSPAVAPSRQRG